MQKLKMHYCFNCGDELGAYGDFYGDRFEACSRGECQNAERDARQQEREEAHEQLDRDLGY